MLWSQSLRHNTGTEGSDPIWVKLGTTVPSHCEWEEHQGPPVSRACLGWGRVVTLAWSWCGGVEPEECVLGKLMLGESATAALEGTSWETEAGRARGSHVNLDQAPPWCTLPQELASPGLLLAATPASPEREPSPEREQGRERDVGEGLPLLLLVLRFHLALPLGLPQIPLVEQPPCLVRRSPVPS